MRLRSSRHGRLGLTVVVMVFSMARTAAATDEGALTLEGGPSMRYGSMSPSLGSGDAVQRVSGGARLGLRYGFTGRLEVQASGFWEWGTTFVQEPVSVPSGGGTVTGTLRQDVSRFGGALGVRYALLGMVWRMPVGIDLGWTHTAFANRDLLSSSDGTSLGLNPGDRTSDQLSVAPFLGLEWLATDHLSFAIVPRLEVLVGTPSTVSVVVPFTIGWSWYPF
jgi:hypothetical protein